MRTEILAGFYVYGAICYLLIGAAAIGWHDRLAFAIVLAGATVTVLSYMIQALCSVRWRTYALGLVFLGWALPAVAALRLEFMGI